MKYGYGNERHGPYKSLPARGVWIEILQPPAAFSGCPRHSPQGECGLKLYEAKAMVEPGKSLPARGVWIEIYASLHDSAFTKSLPARGVWIEIWRNTKWSICPRHSPQGECGLKYAVQWRSENAGGSLPARGVWIEIRCCLPDAR